MYSGELPNCLASREWTYFSSNRCFSPRSVNSLKEVQKERRLLKTPPRCGLLVLLPIQSKFWSQLLLTFSLLLDHCSSTNDCSTLPESSLIEFPNAANCTLLAVIMAPDVVKVLGARTAILNWVQLDQSESSMSEASDWPVWEAV